MGEGNGNPLQYPCLENPMGTVHGVAEGRTQLSDFTFTFHFHALEKEMATHSSVLAWRIPGTAEPGGLPCMGSHRVGHDWSDFAAAAALINKAGLHLPSCCCLMCPFFHFSHLLLSYGQAKTFYQIRSVAQSCPTFCDPMNRSTPGLPVHHQLPEFTQSHVHRVSDAIQPSHPLPSPSPPAPNPSHHLSLFQWVNSSHEVAKVLEFQR